MAQSRINRQTIYTLVLLAVVAITLLMAGEGSGSSLLIFDNPPACAQPVVAWVQGHADLLKVGLLGLLALLAICSVRKWSLFEFRAQATAIVMGWVALFNLLPLPHTCVIALSGYLLWLLNRPARRINYALFLLLFLLSCIASIDWFTPSTAQIISHARWLLAGVFSIVWVYMIWETFICPVYRLSCDASPRIPAAADAPIDIICPCYNPLPGVLAQLAASMATLRAHYPQRRMRLIVADDGSARGFGANEQEALLAQIPDTEIANLPHGGKGAAIRGGMRLSQAPYVVYTDTDMPYEMSSMCQVIDQLMAGADVVIAVRNASYHAKLSPLRKLMSYGSKMLNRIFLNTRHTDTQGGLKGLSAAAREVMLRTQTNDFLFDTEFVALASSEGVLSIEEVETTLRDGVILSKMSLRVMFRELKNFFRIAFRL